MRLSRERTLAGLIELVLLVALLVLLVVATIRFENLLDRTGITWTKGLPVVVLFAVAFFLTGKRFLQRARRLRDGDSDGISGNLQKRS